MQECPGCRAQVLPVASRPAPQICLAAAAKDLAGFEKLWVTLRFSLLLLIFIVYCVVLFSLAAVSSGLRKV